MNKIENEIWNKEEAIICPVCGRYVQLFEVCVCGWENTGETNIDGGPNNMKLSEAIEAFNKGEPIFIRHTLG